MNYDELLGIADNATGGPWKASESVGEWSVHQEERPWATIAAATMVYPECTIPITEADAKYFEAFQPSVVRELLRDAARYQWFRDNRHYGEELAGAPDADYLDAYIDLRRNSNHGL